MDLLGVIAIAITMAVVVLGLTIVAKRGILPVGFESMRECAHVRFTARWASRQVGPQDPRYRPLLSLNLRLGGFPIQGFYFLYYISRRDLEILAPFIDEMIEGKGPPLNLPAEYEDERPATLAKFKTRMQQEGLWPKSTQLSE